VHCKKLLPRLGGADRPRGAIEQADAEPRLQFGDGARDRARRAAEATGGFGEATALGDLDECGDAFDAIHIIAYNAIIMCKEAVLSSRLKRICSAGTSTLRER
jgi:hypothetical protein